MKHEWRKKEKALYLPPNQPVALAVPQVQYLSISGQGNPNGKAFAACVQALYTLAYAIKMTLKKGTPPPGYHDYTVYPLEGVWGLDEAAIKRFDGTINKDSLVYDLMIRQPDFVTKAFYGSVLATTQAKKQNPLLGQAKLSPHAEGLCVQMTHLGPFDTEGQSLAQMADYAQAQGLARVSKTHREIYLTDFRKIAPEKLKTVLRFRVA